MQQSGGGLIPPESPARRGQSEGPGLRPGRRADRFSRGERDGLGAGHGPPGDERVGEPRRSVVILVLVFGLAGLLSSPDSSSSSPTKSAQI